MESVQYSVYYDVSSDKQIRVIREVDGKTQEVMWFTINEYINFRKSNPNLHFVGMYGATNSPNQVVVDSAIKSDWITLTITPI
jgi:hypothetical protein